jgi:hypothetical protein
MRLPGLALTINARTTLPAAPWKVFQFLSDPLNQCRLAEGWIDVVATTGQRVRVGTEISVRNRLGRAMRAELRLLGANRPRNLLMLVDQPDGPRAFVLWEIASANGEHADPTESVVHLQAVIQPRSLRDRVLMIAGGAAWLRGRANLVLQELGSAAGPVVDQPQAGAWLAR